MYFLSAVLENSSADLHRIVAMDPRLTASSNRERYAAGVSPSSLSGYMSGSGSRGSEREFCLEFEEAGVPGMPPGVPCRGKGGSEFCRSRWERLKISLKLLRPVVEVEALPDGGSWDSGSRLSSWMLPREPRVEDRPFLPSRFGGTAADDDWAERAEVVEFCRTIAGPGEPSAMDVNANDEWDGEGSGEGRSWSRPSRSSKAPIPLSGGRT